MKDIGFLTPEGQTTLELMVRLKPLLSKTEWPQDHAKWLRRADTEPEKIDRVLSEVETVKREGKELMSVAAYAEDLWKRFK